MIKDNQMIVIGSNGDEVVCDILFTHEANGKNYVVFEFLDTHEVSAAIYVPSPGSDEEGTFEDVTTEQEWEMLDELLEEYFDEIEAELEEAEEAEDEEEDESLA